LLAIGEAALEKRTAVLLLIDEVQYLKEDDFGALIMALHKVSQKQLPIILVGAGLPQLVGLAGCAKSYAERLFEYPDIGALNLEDATTAIRRPLNAENCEITPEAMNKLYQLTQGYPFFLQTWAYAMWNIAENCPITLEVLNDATTKVIGLLDNSFFRVQFDRLTPREKDYVKAMADLGPRPHRSGDIAEKLRKDMSA
jgi:hypothetical protein